MRTRPILRATPLAIVVAVVAGLGAPSASARGLTFEERVRAQEAIERVYYSHQIGAKEAFEEALPRKALEDKVRKYLRQTAALETIWKTPVTDEMLGREMERMAAGSRLPDRLLELYAALGNDAFLIKECLARQVLVDRLSRNFFAFDATIHDEARKQAEDIRRQLAEGRLAPWQDHTSRSVVEIAVRGRGDEATAVDPSRRELTTGSEPARTESSPEEYAKQRGRWPAGMTEISKVEDERDAFIVRAVLSETPTGMRAAVYRFPKVTWDEWWRRSEGVLGEGPIEPVAQDGGIVPAPSARPEPSFASGDTTSVGSSYLRPFSTLSCGGDNTWDGGSWPEGRYDLTAVWTGSAMVFWGGRGDGGYLNTGGRYDPATDTLTPTSTINAPTGRYGHTAIWTGSLMVVWGGTNLGTMLNTGGRFNPATDTWTTTSTTNAPSPRLSHTAVWTGSRMVVWGGSTTLSVLNTGGRYDPATDTWESTSTTSAPGARFGHSAVWTGSRMVVWGGDDSDHPLDTGARYDPTTNSWTPTSTTNAPSARHAHTAVWTGSLMVVWGGLDVNANYLNTGGRYDPTTDMWTPTSTTNPPGVRFVHTAVWTGSLMVVWGGLDNSGELATGGRYNPATDTWSPTSLTSGARYSHAAVWTGSLMVVWGGVNHGEYIDTGKRYDPVTNTWTPTSGPPFPIPRHSHTAVWTGSLMVVWGGSNDYARLDTGGRYDPVTDNWTPTSITSAPSGRDDHTAVWTGSLMVVWGGYGGADLNTGGRYDPSTDTWTPTSTTNAPGARYLHTAVWTGSLMLVWGGTGGGYLNTGGRYDPATDTWTPTSITNAPSARYKHTAVWTGSLLVVWGGNGGGYLDTGGRYDPATDTWTPTSTTIAPSARDYHTAVWTRSLMIVWGGQDGNGGVGTGGRYDPVADTWTPTSVIGAPSARRIHTAIWTGSLMVVWGGYGSNFLDTGGRYDPAADAWTPTSTVKVPSARDLHTAVWTAGNLMIVWGGNAGGEPVKTGGRLSVVDPADRDGDGYSVCAGDCDDTRASVFPGAPQICDGLNNDCGHPAWPALAGTNEADGDGDTFAACSGDCDDAHATVYPGAPQVCDGLDNDCSDPSWPTLPAAEADYDHDGAMACAGDCNDWDSTVHLGAAEACDGFDDDCDGLVDEGCDGACDNPEKAAAETNLTPGSLGAINGRLAWNGSGFGLVWSDQRDGNPEIYFARFDAAMNRIGGDLRVTNAAGTSDNPWLVWTGMDYGIAWEETRDGYPAIYLARVDPAGNKMGTERSVVAAVTGMVRTPRLVWTDFEFGLFWNDNRSGFWQNGFRTVSADGIVIGTPRGVNTQGYDSNPCQVAWNGAGYLVTNNRAGDTEIYVSRLDAQGFALAPEQRVTYLAGNSRSPTVVWRGTEYGLFWIDNPYGFHELFYARLALDGTKIGTDVRLMIPVTGTLPLYSAAWTGSEYGLAWVDTKDGNSEIYFERIDANGTPVSPQVRVTTDTALSQTPSLQWTGTGFGLAFVDARPGSNAVFGARIACCDDADGDGFTECHECDDTHAAVHPGASQLCDGLNNDCDDPSWPVVPANEADLDADGWLVCAGDCNDSSSWTYPGAPETNDGEDNQCPGDPGYTSIDEISGVSGFTVPGDRNAFCWTAQAGATQYEVVRSTDPRFQGGCVHQLILSGTSWSDATSPSAGQGFYYLVRPIAPHIGSWGATSSGYERSAPCLAESSCGDGLDNDGDGLIDCADPDCASASECIHTLNFTDSFADDVPDGAIFQFFASFQPAPSDYIFFEIAGSSPHLGAWCAENATFYRDGYLQYGPGGGSWPSGAWNKWGRSVATSGGNWVGPFNQSFSNTTCAGPFSWCAERELINMYLAVAPAPYAYPPWCETNVGYAGCTDGTWVFTLRVGPTRLLACGF